MSENSLILPRNNLSTVSFAVGFPTGAAAEDIPGISQVLVSHMMRSTAKHEELAFAKHLDYHGIVPFSNVTKTGLWLGFNTPYSNLGTAIETMREVLFAPEFTESTIKKLVQQQKGNLSQLDQIPNARLFQSTRWVAAFGDSRVSKNSLGTEEGLDSITTENLTSYLESVKTYRPSLVSVGVNIKEDDFSDLQADLDSLGKKDQNLELWEKKVGPMNIQIDKMNAQSKNAYMGINMVSQGYDSPNLEDVIFQNVLSGGFSARMFTEIRDNRNLSYSVFALNSKFNGFGLITAGMDVLPERAPEALEVTLELIKDVLENPVGEDELNRAIKAAQKTALFVSDSSQSYTGYLMPRILSGREWDLDKIKDDIEKAGTLQWQEHMLQFWKKENFSLGIAGEPGETESIWEETVEKVL